MVRRASDDRATCCFCIELVDGAMPADFVQEAGISSRELKSDSRHVLFADARPLAPGHVLIVPKAHVTSLRQLGETGLSDVIAFRETAIAPQPEMTLLAWEHGIGRGREGG